MTFQEIFSEYGADYNNTSQRFMSNKTFYLKILDMLFEGNYIQDLSQCVDNGDYKGAFDVAHTFKGVVGNLGLTPLYNATCQLVDYLRNDGDITQSQALLDNIVNQYHKAELFRNKLKEGQ